MRWDFFQICIGNLIIGIPKSFLRILKIFLLYFLMPVGGSEEVCAGCGGEVSRVSVGAGLRV